MQPVLRRAKVAAHRAGLLAPSSWRAGGGSIAFTDREWTEAKARRVDFWLVVVGNIDLNPIARLIPDPAAALKAECRYQTTIAASWRATVAVA